MRIAISITGTLLSQYNSCFSPTLNRTQCVRLHMSTGREIRLIEEDDGGWSAIDDETGVASQGETRREALDNLDEAVGLTKESREADTDAPEPDAPWFEA